MSGFCGFEVKDSEELGRFVIAKREYKLSDLILDEESLLIAPVGKQALNLSCQDSGEDFDTPTFECVGCFKTLLAEYSEVCPKCFWPVCSKACAQESFHAKYECPLFEQKRIGISDEVYGYIYILRGVLMYQDEINPTLWERLAALCPSYNLNQENCVSKTMEEVQAATHFLKQRFQMNIDEKVVGQIIGAFNVNAFEMSGEDQHGNSHRALAVYSRGCMFCHSCSPNADAVILPYNHNGIKRWNIRIYARRNILCDEPINISYIPDCFALDTAARRSHISNYLHFDCKCSRCKDPSEFSFYTEAITCSSCGDETLTAENPSDEFSGWTCNHCGVSKDYRFAVQSFHASLGLIDNFLSKTTQGLSLTSSNEKCGLGQNHREIIFTMFNWIQDCRIERFQELSQHSTESDESFVKFMKTGTKCLKVFRMFGKMADIVDLESCFARAIATYYFKTVDFVSIRYDPYLPEEKIKILTAICTHLKIAVDTMEWTPYNILYLFLRQDLVDAYKFWKDELKVLKDVCSVDMSDSSDYLKRGGIKVVELKTNERLTKADHEESYSGLLKEAEELENVAASHLPDLLHHDVVTSPINFNSTLMKPPVSHLIQFDFYFDG